MNRRVELAGTLAKLAPIRSGDRPELAEADFAEAVGLLEKACEARPDELAYKLPLAHLLNNWGNLVARRGQPDLALASLARGLALVELPLRSQSTLSDLRLAAPNLHGSRANLLGTLGRHAESVADWDRVLALNDVPADEPKAVRQNRLTVSASMLLQFNSW